MASVPAHRLVVRSKFGLACLSSDVCFGDKNVVAIRFARALPVNLGLCKSFARGMKSFFWPVPVFRNRVWAGICVGTRGALCYPQPVENELAMCFARALAMNQ